MKKYTKKEVLEQGISFEPMFAYQIIKLCKHFGINPNEISYDEKGYYRFYLINGRIYYGSIPNSYLKHPDSSLRSKIEISFEEFDFEDENKEMEIEIPEGYEVDEDKSTFEKIIFKPISKPDFNILNTRDWFYVKTNIWEVFAKGNIIKTGEVLYFEINSKTKYKTIHGLCDKTYIKELRLATNEEIENHIKPLFLEEFRPKWEDFGKVRGYCLDEVGYIIKYNSLQTDYKNRNVWPTKEEVEACLALSQLCQWRDKYNEGWKANWTDYSIKYCIVIMGSSISKQATIHTQYVLNFKTGEILDKFREDFRDLIEIAKPLL